MIRISLPLRPWRMGLLKLHKLTKNSERCLSKVHQMFINNGLMTVHSQKNTKITIQWNKELDEREYEKLVGMFSEVESEIKTPSLLHFDSLVSNWALNTKRPEFAERWLNFRLQKECSRAVKVSLVLDYINSFTGLKPDEIDEQKIINTVSEIKTDLMKVDSVTFTKVIPALCMTSGYKYCLELMMEFTKNHKRDVYLLPRNIAYRLPDVIDAAIRNDDLKFAAEIIREHKDISNQFLLTLWKRLLQHSDTLSVDCIFELLSSVDNFNLPHSIKNDLLQVLEKDKKQWTVFKNSLIKDKHCKSCGEKIEPCFFDGEGMEMIKTNISATLDRHNKERFSTFLQFLHFLEDVNYVVDGMWINHHFLFKENKKYLSTMELEDYLHQYLPGKKLIIARNVFFHQHEHIFDSPDIIGFPVNYSNDERTKSASSLDDLFLLYAALHFNQSCYILTGDFMRDHVSKLKENLTELCSRWILSKSVMTDQKFAPNSWTLPITAKPFVKTEKGWHISTSNRIHSPTVWCIQECR